MAQGDGTAIVSAGGIHPISSEIKPLGQQEKFNLETSVPNISQTYTSIAMAPNLVGQLSAQVAQSAANTRATLQGLKSGQNPHGDLIPAITQTDKAYQDAYLAQSQNTLSLQANTMFAEASEQLNQSYELSNEMISQYQNQMAKGAQDILENAPSVVKANLGYQYASQIQDTTHSLYSKLIAQNKQKAIDHMNVVDRQTDIDIINKAMSGDLAGAEQLYQSKIEKNALQKSSGMMKESQEYTSNESAKISYFTAISNSRALEERQKGGKYLEKYLSSLANPDNKPEGLNYDQYNAIGNNTLSLMRHMDALEQTERNDVITGINTKIEDGTFTGQELEQAKDNKILKQSDINVITAKWNRWQANNEATQSQLLSSLASFSDTSEYAQLTASQQNKVYQAQVASAKQRNPNAEPGIIEAEVASSAGGPNQSFFKQLEALSRSPIPAEMEQASRMFHIVNSRSPENIVGMPQDTIDNIHAFDSFSELFPEDVNTASEKTRQVMIPKTKDQNDANNEIWNDYRRQNLSTPADQMIYARNVLGANGVIFKTDVANATETAKNISNILERYTKLFNGDVAAAKLATQKAVSTIYGETHANGIQQSAKYPIEKFTGFGRKSTFFIQQDVVNSLQQQFGHYRKAYDEGRSNFFYRIKDADKWSNVNIEAKVRQSNDIKNQLMEIDKSMESINSKRNKDGYLDSIKYDNQYKENIQKRNTLYKKLSPLESELSKINNWDGQIEIEQVWKGPTKKDGRVVTYPLSINAGDNASFSYDSTQPIVGDYDIFLTTETGGKISIQQMAGRAVLPIVYKPNFNEIRKNTAGYINITGGQITFKQAIEDYKKSLLKPEESKTQEIMSERETFLGGQYGR